MISIIKNNPLIKYYEITEEEKNILKNGYVERDLYANGNNSEFTIDSKKLMENNVFYIRKHTRFCNFPKHRHNYVEINYVLDGKVHQVIDGKDVVLEKGDVLFLNQSSEHEIKYCSQNDILINLIILPVFYDFCLEYLHDDSIVKKFLIETMKKSSQSQYLIFRVSDVIQIQNIFHNILLDYDEKSLINKDSIKFSFLVLIFELMKHIDKIEGNNSSNYDSLLMLKVLKYVDEHYSDGNLQDLCYKINEDYYYVSKQIKRLNGTTFQNLIQEKRLEIACDLLISTDLCVDEIAFHVGYENLSFFYKIFKRRFNMTPYEYRKSRVIN